MNNYQESYKFYDEILAVLEMKRVMLSHQERRAIYGSDKNESLFEIIQDGEIILEEPIGKKKFRAIPFVASSIQMVNEWYERCLELGARSKRSPEFEVIDPIYSATIIDPSGYKIETSFFDLYV